MNQELGNFEQKLRNIARADPFVPFEIVTSSGEHYEVSDSLQIAMGSTAVVLVLSKTGIRTVRMNTITAVHVHEPI